MGALTDCASILFYFEYDFPKKNTASIIYTFGYFYSTKLSFIDHRINSFGSKTELQANFLSLGGDAGLCEL